MIDHPITPPTDLLSRWEEDWHHSKVKHVELEDHIAAKAAQYGLKISLDWLLLNGYGAAASRLSAALRPKPPSLKEQALEALQFVDEKLDLPLHNHCNAIHTIRLALEALDD
jgi:hypothetical protein